MIINGQETSVEDFFNSEYYDFDLTDEGSSGYIKDGDPAVGYRFMYKSANNDILYPPLFGNKAWIEYDVKAKGMEEGKLVNKFNFPFYEGQVNHVPKSANYQNGIFFFSNLSTSYEYFQEQMLKEAALGVHQQVFKYKMEYTTDKKDWNMYDIQLRSRSAEGLSYNPFTKKWYRLKESEEGPNKYTGWKGQRWSIEDVGEVDVRGSYNLYRIEGTYHGQHRMELGEIINDFYIPTEPIISLGYEELHDYLVNNGKVSPIPKSLLK